MNALYSWYRKSRKSPDLGRGIASLPARIYYSRNLAL
nr:MAG TPA: hypothetical protein [Caudoviricetes sp.]